MKERKTTLPVLRDNQKATLSTQIRIQELAGVIAEKGYGRLAAKKYVVEHWGLSDKQAERYYYGALDYLRPEDPDKYREALIARNFGVLESMLQRALETNDLSSATQIVKVMNTMLNVGDKKIQLEQGDTKIVVSFGE